VSLEDILGETVTALRAELSTLRKATRRCSSVRRLISKREAARQLGIDRATTLQQLIDRGEIRTVKLAGKIRIPVSEIERVSAPSSSKEQGLSLKTQTRSQSASGHAIRALPF